VDEMKCLCGDVIVHSTCWDNYDPLKDIIAKAVAAEREACAKIAENHLLWAHGDSCYEEIAAAIRARS
jgi:hypothetical protein